MKPSISFALLAATFCLHADPSVGFAQASEAEPSVGQRASSALAAARASVHEINIRLALHELALRSLKVNLSLAKDAQDVIGASAQGLNQTLGIDGVEDDVTLGMAVGASELLALGALDYVAYQIPSLPPLTARAREFGQDLIDAKAFLARASSDYHIGKAESHMLIARLAAMQEKAALATFLDEAAGNADLAKLKRLEKAGRIEQRPRHAGAVGHDRAETSH